MHLIFFLILLLSSNLFSKEQSVYDIISKHPNLSTFNEYLNRTELDDVLQKKIPYDWTVYAPSNNAFINVPKELKELILSDNYYSKRLFTDHILAKEILATDITEQVTTELTVSNKAIKLYKSESLFIKDIVIVREDIIAENGVIHIIDCIMFIQPSSQDSRLSPSQQESFPITSCCMQTGTEVSLWRENTKKSF